MRARGSRLQRPCQSAVSRGDDRAISADRPSVRAIAGRKGDRVKMILDRRRDFDPALTSVCRSHDGSAPADRDRAALIKNVQAVQRND